MLSKPLAESLCPWATPHTPPQMRPPMRPQPRRVCHPGPSAVGCTAHPPPEGPNPNHSVLGATCDCRPHCVPTVSPLPS